MSRTILATFVTACLLAGCSAAPPSEAIRSLNRLPTPTTSPVSSTLATESTTTTVSASVRECEDRGMETASVAPDPNLTIGPGTFMDEIRQRGRLRVGVDEQTEGFAALDSETRNIVGFEADLAHAIFDSLFPDGGGDLELIPLVTSQKTKFVANGKVDLTISAVSMTCDRWQQVAFSAEYYTAHQQFLVRADSDIHDADDLIGRKICVTQSSSSKDILDAQVPNAELLEVPSRTDCLVALENDDVDAYFGHDTFLYGMKAQDHTVEIRPDILDDKLTVSHYGIAIAREHEDFVRYINGVLESVIADGTWQELVDDYLTPLDIPPIQAPTPDYRRVHV